MSVKGKSKRKQQIQRRDKDAARKITMIVIGATILVMLLMYFLYSD